MNPIRQDTSPGQLAEYYRLLRGLSPAQRLRAASAAIRRMRMLAEAGIRLRHPDASEERVRRELILLLYGPEAVARLSRPLMQAELGEVEDVALRVASALQGLGVLYLVGGSVASSLLGEPRATNDVDFLVELPEERVSALAQALGPDFDVDEEALRDAIRKRIAWNIFYLPLVTKVDLFPRRDDPFDAAQLARRRFVPLRPDGGGLYVASPEDVVLGKLAWYRQGGEGSTTQWRDILGVLAVSGRGLDKRYLSEWGTRLGVSDLLAEAFREAAP